VCFAFPDILELVYGCAAASYKLARESISSLCSFSTFKFPHKDIE
jgi:hypothetical protein